MRSVPEHYRRAVRLSLAVLLPCVLGYGVLLPQQLEMSKSFAQGCKWAAMASVVVSMPVIAKVSQVGAERCIGTVLGGCLGFLVHDLGSRIWTDETDGVVLSIAAAVVAFCSVVVGYWLGLDLSAKLFCLTFLLVTFGAQEGKDPLQLFITRSGGIVAGVLTMLVLSIVVLPKSASMEAVHNLEKALQSLSSLNQLAWRKYLPAEEPPPAEKEKLGGSATKRASSNGYEVLPGEEPARPPPHSHTVAMHPPGASCSLDRKAAAHAEFEQYERQCEKVLTDIYQSLFKLQENCDLGKSEILLFTCRGHQVYIPGLPFVGMKHQHLPWEGIGEMASSIRRVARLLLTVISTMEQGFERDMEAVLGGLYPDRLMHRIAEASQGAVKGMCSEFPGGSHCTHTCLAQLTLAVSDLVQVSDTQRRSIVRALRGGRHRKFARQAWQRLIDVVRAQPAAEPQQPPEQQSFSEPSSPSSVRRLPAAAGGSALRANSGGGGGGSGSKAAGAGPAPGAAAPGPAVAAAKAQPGAQPFSPFLASPAGTQSRAPPAGRARAPEGSGFASFRDTGSLETAATNADQLAAAAAQLQRDLLGGGPGSTGTSRTASEAEGLAALVTEGKEEGDRGAAGASAAALAASLGPEPQLLAHRLADLEEGSLGGSPASPLSRSLPAGGLHLPPGWREGLRAISSDELEGLMPNQGERAEGVGDGAGAAGPAASPPLGGSPTQSRRVNFLGAGDRSETLRLAMFPETAEGYVAQVRWYSFQFVMEELVDELAQLHSALSAVLRQLP